jgi:hypothetical protein
VVYFQTVLLEFILDDHQLSICQLHALFIDLRLEHAFRASEQTFPVLAFCLHPCLSLFIINKLRELSADLSALI